MKHHAPDLSRYETCFGRSSQKHHALLLPIVAVLLFSASMAWSQRAEDYPLGDIPLNATEYTNHAVVFAASALEALPASYDARTQGIVTPARDQGGCGSCWAFASVAALESHLLSRAGGAMPDLSEQQQVSCNTAQAGCVGGSSTAIRFWESRGPVAESCFPYTASSATACASVCSAMEYRVVNWHTVNSTTADFKASCFSKGPSYWRFNVYSDFYSYWNSGTPGQVYRNTGGSYQGGHAVLIIGWDDAKGAFLCKNSWGRTGGPNRDGTFWLAYDSHVNNLGFGMANFDLVFVGNPGLALGDALDLPGLAWITSGDASWAGQTQINHDGQDAAASGTIPHLGQTWVQATFSGPGTVSYWWKVSSEPGWDFLRVLVDGAEQARISGETGWEQRSVTLTSGLHTVRWRYDKDGTGTYGSDRGWLDQITFSPIVPPEISVSLDGALLADGQTAAVNFGSVIEGQAGPTKTFTVRNIGGQTLTLGAVNVAAGYTLTEGLATSLAPGQADTFTVSLVTATAGAKSGQISFVNNDSDESPFNFPVTGVVTPRPTLVYVDGASACATPDGSPTCPFKTVCAGYDTVANCGTVRIRRGSYALCRSVLNKCAVFTSDNGPVTLLPPSAGSPAAAEGPLAQLQGPARRPDGTFALRFKGVVGQHYQVFASTNLVSWALWKDFIADENSAELIDPDAVSTPSRFFKLVTP